MSSTDVHPERLRFSRFGLLRTIVETPSSVISLTPMRWRWVRLENAETESSHMLS